MNNQHPASRRNREQSDVKRLYHKHLTDLNHVITEEELATFLVGVSQLSIPATDQNQQTSTADPH